MSRIAPGDVRIPRVDAVDVDIATFMIARVLADVYQDTLHEPVPEKLAEILRQIEAAAVDHPH